MRGLLKIGSKFLLLKNKLLVILLYTFESLKMIAFPRLSFAPEKGGNTFKSTAAELPEQHDTQHVLPDRL